MPTSAAGSEIARAQIADMLSDGTVVLAAGGRRCDLTDAARLTGVEPGDEVLVWLPATADQNGVILARIGPARVETPAPDEPPAILVVEARQRLILRVGDGSITIRDDGKILIQGKDLVSHARRVNRIKGGAVAIN
jgi:hypothetical protein